MKYVILLAVVLVIVDARITIRHRRQIEREDASSSTSDLPASEVVVIKDTANPSLPGPLFLVPRLPGPGDAFDLDINERDGTFMFGGQLPSSMHHHHSVGHQSFGSLFEAIQRRFDEMTKNMMSFNNFGPGFNPTTDISSLPDDFNKTDSEIVELGGHRFVKKTTTIKKGGPGATFFVRSTTFERVNENDNADVPSEEEANKKDKPVVEDGTSVEESAPGNASQPAPADPKDESPVASSSTESPKVDAVPSSSTTESPASSPSAAEEEERSPAASEGEGVEKEGEPLSPSSSPAPTTGDE